MKTLKRRRKRVLQPSALRAAELFFNEFSLLMRIVEEDVNLCSNLYIGDIVFSLFRKNRGNTYAISLLLVVFGLRA
jgi:hypothetical protein